MTLDEAIRTVELLAGTSFYKETPLEEIFKISLEALLEKRERENAKQEGKI